MLAVVTAVIDARGACRAISAHTLAAYRPPLDVIAGAAVAGLVIALTGLRAPLQRRTSGAAAEDGRREAELEPVREGAR